MRVVGGTWRGRPLVAPAGRATRPTSDKVREAIFDVLQALPEMCPPGGREAAGAAPSAAGPAATTPAGPLAGHVVLDLYAGSGALGIEALSRGAARCTFVERERAALSALRRNLASVGVPVVKGGEKGPGGGDAPAPAEAASGGGEAPPAARPAG
jgi:16S rRNA (guanine966-N2)-methyltransferase